MNSVLWFVGLLFFISHIPITLLIDAQAVIPHRFYSKFLLDLVEWYSKSFSDPLMAIDNPIWFRAIVAGEVFFQFPFFFFAIWSLIKRNDKIRIPMCIYASHVCTTLIPIFASLFFENPAASTQQKAILFMIYSPYFFIPFALGLYCALNPVVFPPSSSVTSKRQKSK